MRIVLDTGDADRELAVEVDVPDVAVGEVLAAAGVDPVEVVDVDGRRVPVCTTVDEAGLGDGAVLRLGSLRRPLVQTDHDPACPRLDVVAGPGTGASVPLDRAVVVGRGAASDLVVPSPVVADLHCRVVPAGRGSVTVTHLAPGGSTWAGGREASTGGTAVAIGEVLRVGPAVLRVQPAVGDDRPRRAAEHAGAMPFNRPPRPGPPPPVPPVDVPASPIPVDDPARPGLAALLVPLVLAGVMVVVLGSWRYAAFLVLSPVLVGATALAGHRRAARRRRTAAGAHHAAVEVFADDLAQAAEATRQRTWEVLPSVAEVLRRAAQPSTRLWERRPHHEDALQLVVGIGATPWTPALRGDGLQGAAGAAREVLDEWHHLPRSPVGLTLADGGVVGVVGDRTAAVAVARSLLLQVCVHHGPADLRVAVGVAAVHVGDWDWAGWLPHVADAAGRRRVGAGPAATRALLTALRDEGDLGTTLLLVLDDPALLHGPDARALLAGGTGPVAGIVLAETVDQLPAVCDTVVEAQDAVGHGRVVRPAQRTRLEAVVLAGLPVATCRRAARRLARQVDPEVDRVATGLPRRADLVDLLDDGFDVDAAWDRNRDRADLRVPIGVGPDGAAVVDLVVDGPHALVAGTTGSGKSELLRSLVAGLAATHGPEHCTFLLVDYKGGAAFDACAQLPHVVGLVTDLDDHLGARALRCLDAELAHRERRLRAAGASDLAAWRRLPAGDRGEPLPRLVVVVDEFATLRAELPDFVHALVGVAQRGRSLGVHLVLGTQRPGGAVDDDVRANVNLRLALRTTGRQDSSDVVGVGDAADISASVPGRGVLRAGSSPPVAVQAALVTARRQRAAQRVRVGPVRFAPRDLPPVHGTEDDGPSDLDHLVVACRRAAATRGIAPPRQPWPPPLPASLPPASLPTTDDVLVPLGLLDEPDRQRQVTTGWDPRRGNLLVHGAVGSGTTTTLATLALAAARHHGPDELHLHVLDLGRGELVPLDGLPHCGAVVTGREHERRERLQAWLLAEAARRRGLDHGALARLPRQVLLVDGLATWLDELDRPDRYADLEEVQQLLADAPQLRMAVVGSVPRPGAVRTAIAAGIEQWLAHRLADPNDLAALGLRPGDVPDLPPGRAVRPDGGVLQVARSGSLSDEVAAIAAVTAPPRRPPAAIGALPARMPVARLAGEVTISRGPWRLPVGLDALTLAPAYWTLHHGEHALVLGPPSSGRSGLLHGLAVLAAPHGHVVAVTTVARDWSAPVEVRGPTELAAVLDEALGRSSPTLVLVDDAEAVADPGPALGAVASTTAAASVRVVAAARTTTVHGDYGHWLRVVARSRTGLFLRPRGDVPGDLLGVRLPLRAPVATRPGRGWLVEDGRAQFVQVLDPR